MKTRFFLCFLTLWLLTPPACSPPTTQEHPQEHAHRDGGERDEPEVTSERPPELPETHNTEPQETPTESVAENTPEHTAPLTIDAICDRIAQTTCTVLFKCCQTYGLKYASEAACQTNLQQSCQSAYEREKKALAAGHMIIDKSQLARCIQATKDAGAQCHVIPSALSQDACQGIIQDKASGGEECKSQLGGVHCANNKGVCFAEPTGFPCKIWSPQGQACSKAPCAPGLFCDPQDPVPALCRAPADKGEACRVPAHCKEGLACLNKLCSDPLDEGKACDNVFQCKEGFACDISQTKCVATQKLGESCSFPLHCGRKEACQSLTTGLICQKAKQQGEACTQSKECIDDHGCISGSCQPLPQTGQTCQPTPGCRKDAYCDTTSQKCVALPKDGETCRTSKPKCATGLTCFQSSSTCKPPGQADALCQDDEECEPGVYGCQSGRCTLLPKENEPCFQDVICHKSVVCDLQKKTCVPRKKEGEECPLGFECALTLACITDTDKIKRCRSIPKEGESCTLTCADGLRCRPGIVKGRCIPGVCQGALKTP
ncbi:MAG TPA: hypothetical protein DCE42_11535 [Myxococcales bacterium]|nr:hypothetical protein [Deltaproteobacteria bacterium]HAA55382.1 hypothetical protein [Myxococcales bacterium]